MNIAQLEHRVKNLERTNACLVAGCICCVLAVLVGSLTRNVPPVKAADDERVLRLKGLVIEDEQGRARILIGAPFPVVSERLRKDVSGVDMVFLDEEGHDRFTVGEMMPAAPGFHRIGSAYGLNIFDTTGHERGG